LKALDVAAGEREIMRWPPGTWLRIAADDDCAKITSCRS
jgi:hypothetical protein